MRIDYTTTEALAWRIEAEAGLTPSGLRRWAGVLGIPAAHLYCEPLGCGGWALVVHPRYAGQGESTRRLAAGCRAIAGGAPLDAVLIAMTAAAAVPDGQAERSAAFFRAAGADQWAEALRLARAPVPADADEAAARNWGNRRAIARQALAGEAAQ